MLRCVVLGILLVAPAAASASLSLGGEPKLVTRSRRRPVSSAYLGCVSSCRARSTTSKATIQVDLGKGAVNLKDAYADLVVGQVVVRLGQFKKPFSRQQLISSSRLALVDRAATDKAFKAGRDLGLMIHNGNKGRFEYALGAFNGHGDKGVLNGMRKFSNLTGAAPGCCRAGRLQPRPRRRLR